MARRRLASLVEWGRAWLTTEPQDEERLGAPPFPRMVQRAVDLGRRRPMLVDGLLALALVVAGVRTGHGLDVYRSKFSYGNALTLLLAAPLIWRRRFPIAVFGFLCGVGLAQWFLQSGSLADLALLVALYTVASRYPRRVALGAAATLEVGVLLAAAQHENGVFRGIVYLSGMVAAAFFLGTTIRTRRAYLGALVDRAARLERERDQQARMAVAAERASIAREMHDIVAHSLAVVVTMADAAARKQRTDPEVATAAMHQVSETGRQALGETRRLLAVLRAEGPPIDPGPQPGLTGLEGLLEPVRATGLQATLTIAGRPFPVAEGAQLAVYRIVQEAVTNVLKHARDATRLDVTIRYQEGGILIDVSDDGAPSPSPPGTVAAGHGLVGMRERASLYAGSVTAGPGPEGGWRVRATVNAGGGGEAPAAGIAVEDAAGALTGTS